MFIGLVAVPISEHLQDGAEAMNKRIASVQTTTACLSMLLLFTAHALIAQEYNLEFSDITKIAALNESEFVYVRDTQNGAVASVARFHGSDLQIKPLVKSGRGPNEMLMIADVDVDYATKQIIFASGIDGKIIIQDLDGKLRQEVLTDHIPVFGVALAGKTFYVSRKIVTNPAFITKVNKIDAAYKYVNGILTDTLWLPTSQLQLETIRDLDKVRLFELNVSVGIRDKDVYFMIEGFNVFAKCSGGNLKSAAFFTDDKKQDYSIKVVTNEAFGHGTRTFPIGYDILSNGKGLFTVLGNGYSVPTYSVVQVKADGLQKTGELILKEHRGPLIATMFKNKMYYLDGSKIYTASHFEY
jgi:hypothetical protein